MLPTAMFAGNFRGRRADKGMESGNRRRPAAVLLLVAVAVSLACAAQAAQSVADTIAQGVAFAATQLEATAAAKLPAGQFPNSTDLARPWEWDTTGVDKWTAGYLCGCYYRMYALTGNKRWLRLGAAQLPALKAGASATDNHKVSHIYDSSYGEAIAAAPPGTNIRPLQKVLQTAAASLAARYNAKVGLIRSWRDINDMTDFQVIIDSMASLKIMWEAAAMPGGKKEWANIAMTHSRNIAKNHFRPDGSVYQKVRFNPRTGRRTFQGNHQAYSDTSIWSRGQAWAVVGFTHVYNITRDPAMLATAVRASDTYLRLTTKGREWVPLWDFKAPKSQAWKDSSAAAIAASGLLRLGKLTGWQNYTTAGTKITAWLTRHYLSTPSYTGGPLLASILRNGTFSAPIGHHSTGLIWGDWYYLDALSQLKYP